MTVIPAAELSAPKDDGDLYGHESFLFSLFSFLLFPAEKEDDGKVSREGLQGDPLSFSPFLEQIRKG